MKIITTSKIQKNISILSDNNGIYTVVKNWEPKSLIVPYFEGIEDYIEDIEMYANKDKLTKKYNESIKSGISDFVI